MGFAPSFRFALICENRVIVFFPFQTKWISSAPLTTTIRPRIVDRMKRQWLILIGIFVLLLAANLFWLTRTPPVAAPIVTLVPISDTNAVAAPVFRVVNGDPRAILLTDIIIETNSPTGWQAFSHTVPTHPQRLAPGVTKDLMTEPPESKTPWRLRVTYGTDVVGPKRWFGKIAFGVSHFTWPSRSLGFMEGSNSLISAEMRKAGR